MGDKGENRLFYGDNLDVLRRHVPDESVDLVYLDPPFNSNADYNVLFAEQDGTRAEAQIHAFEDTWRWDLAAVRGYEALTGEPGRVADAMRAFRTFLGESDMMAYLVMMAPRLVELRRVLKLSGVLYLHCDPTASHYLKLLLDGVFGPQNFLSEIAWKRTGSHSSANRWGPVHDILLYYGKDSGKHTWNRPYVPLDEGHRKRHYRRVDEVGRAFTHGELTAPGVRHGRSGMPWEGFDVTAIGRHWMTTIDKLDAMKQEGRIYIPHDGGWPRLIRFEDESKGRAVGDIWEDIPPINMKAAERLGYPTQKPEALLERLLKASSNDGDTILDPFCGCGTTIAVAQRLKRRWIGIDVTHLAIGLIKHRLFHSLGVEAGEGYNVIGEPTDLSGARKLAHDDKHQFEHWTLGLVHARSSAKGKGADRGIDGRLYFHDEAAGGATKQVILSIKGGEKIPANAVRDLRGVIEREKAEIGVLISITAPTKAMRKEAASAGFYKSPWTQKDHPRLQLLTVEELMTGKGIDMPTVRATSVTFKKAPKAKEAGPVTGLLFGGKDAKVEADPAEEE